VVTYKNLLVLRVFQFHKIAACTALFFSLLHTVGHIVNFYHVSTQPVENLRCLTSEVHFPSDYKPGITFWLFQTITGKLSCLLANYFKKYYLLSNEIVSLEVMGHVD
jgi:hypothetical protein